MQFPELCNSFVQAQPLKALKNIFKSTVSKKAPIKVRQVHHRTALWSKELLKSTYPVTIPLIAFFRSKRTAELFFSPPRIIRIKIRSIKQPKIKGKVRVMIVELAVDEK